MKPVYSLATLALPLLCNAAPLAKKQSAITDVDVLQFALTLEHLENVYYQQALSQFSEQDFIDAGFSSDFFNNVNFIAEDEQQHVSFLTTAIQGAGATPVAACNYNFASAFDSVQAFVGLGSVLEGVGVSAYLGGAPAISSKDILAVAGAILVSEGLHQGVHRASLEEVASANIAGTALSPNAVFSLAAAFIVECPPSNAALPFTAFPGLNAMTAQPNAVNEMSVFSASGDVPDGSFVTFVSGLETTSVPATSTGGTISVAVPETSQGQTYVFITNTAVNGTLQDSQVVAGPAVVEVTPAPPVVNTSVQ